MARKPRTPAEDAGVEKVEQRVTKLPTKKTITDWLKAKAEHRSALDTLNTNMAEHTRNAQKKHMDKVAAGMLDKLARMTPEKLARKRARPKPRRLRSAARGTAATSLSSRKPQSD